MTEYAHTLIPDTVDFVPEPLQVERFLTSLTEIGAAPLEFSLSVGTFQGRIMQGINPFTGKTLVIPQRSHVRLEEIHSVSDAIKALNDYDVWISGKGPPPVPPLTFDFDGTYEVSVVCSLRPEVVSTSDYHDECGGERKVEFFGRPCSPTQRTGVFHNPSTLEVIEVANAGCARFWIKFQYGGLFPEVESDFDLLNPSILETARQEFGRDFAQGCNWCA